jgi:hypothetical protein
MEITTSTQIRVQRSPNFYYTAENINIDVKCDGFTLSYWEFDKEDGDTRVGSIIMNKEEALAIADAIYKLFKN